MNNKVSNPKTEIPMTKEMNDLDYLTDILEMTKNMVNNYSYALNETSNDTLYETYFQIFEEVSNIQRDLFDLMFQKGWYCLEKANQEQINKSKNKYSEQLNQI